MTRTPTLRGWPPVLVLPPAAVLTGWWAGWPPWLVMWATAFAVYVGCKWLTWRRTDTAGAAAWVHLAYLVGWPGLDAKAFFRRSPLPPRHRPDRSEWVFAAAKTAIGAAVLWGVTPAVRPEVAIPRGWAGMVGLVFLLHFGLFHLLSCLWRMLGRDAKPLMNWPVLARSLSEFWGRRWNTAFRDLTHRFLFAPLAARLGPKGAVAVGFLFSGIVHDAVISLPAGGGYGLPTLYFVIQGCGLLLERRVGSSRLFTAAVLLAPAYWLFHPPFVLTVILPFLAVLGAT